MRERLSKWKFIMMYRGRFERPAGVIYDCFDRDVHLIPRFTVPDRWPRHLGLDFGGVNTAGIFLAQEPGTNRYVLYRDYKAGSRTARQHKDSLLKGEPSQPKTAGGSWSEDNWRGEFAAAGLPVSRPPIRDVEVGIDRVYAMLRSRPGLNEGQSKGPYLEIVDDLADTVDEIESSSTSRRRKMAACLSETCAAWTMARIGMG